MSDSNIPIPSNVASPPLDSIKTSSGLFSKILQEGTGNSRPQAHDKVTVHYSGWTLDGKMFDSSVARGAPATFGLDQVIAGWTEGLQLMTVGEKRRFWIPADLAYGENPGFGRPGGMLCFEVELLEIESMPTPPEAPENITKVPDEAEVSATGLASLLITKGLGTKKPSASDSVEVHYSGWTLDGKLFDSSIVRGETVTFPLDRVIKGWTEGLQLMVEREKRRFWIPADLAYGTNPQAGAPAGTLCFDVELVKIH